MRKARLELDAIRADASVSALFSDEVTLDAVNTAVDAAYTVLRLAGTDIVTKIINSTDSAVDFITESYTPSSFRLVADTATYTLPPDLVKPVAIRPITSGFDGVVFRPSSVTRTDFIDYRSIPTDELSSVSGGAAIYWYTLTGPRTLLIVPTPKDTIDLAFTYQYRPPRLLNYPTGTVGTGGASSTTVTGAGTDWVNIGLRTPAELVVGAVATDVNIGTYYPQVSAISSATSLTMSKAQVIANGSAYRISMVPLLPEEYHTWLAQRAAAVLLRKISLQGSQAAQASLDSQLLGLIQPEVAQRQAQESLTTEPAQVFMGW